MIDFHTHVLPGMDDGAADAGEALEKATEKFIDRFSAMETAIFLAGKRFQDLTISEMDVYWERNK